MIHVTCAIIHDANNLLLCQRSAQMAQPLKWEFPGGKIEMQETKEECLKREIKEELALEIIVGKELSSVTHAYPTFSITLYPFLCEIRSGSIQLAEHAQAKWVDWRNLHDFDWADADKPIVEAITHLFATNKA